MGSSSSKGSSGSSSRIRRTKQRLSSMFLCGASSSYIPLQFEDHPAKSPLTSVEALNTSDTHETGSSSGSCTGITEDGLLDCDLITLEASSTTRLPDNGEPNSHQPSQDPIPTLVAAVDAHISEEETATIKSSDSKQSSSVDQERRNSAPDQNHRRGQGNIPRHISDSVPVPIAPIPVEVNQVTRGENPQMAAAFDPGYHMSDSVEERIREDMLHVDRLSISSNILSTATPELSNGEWRNRRLFWDSFSRRRSRRHSDSPTILFASGRTDELGSRDRWHRSLHGGLQHFGVGHRSRSLGVEAHRNEGRWLGSEISDRLLSTLSEFDQQTTLCASGLHPHGTCTCESLYTDEEFSALASISRIITLAETLFEVLEELYRQPFSFSPSMPAPESVVDSFPIKHYKKSEVTGSASEQSDLPQCYICLAEYEDGEQLRVLPCQHEYHMSCIDKWLKEINRVCPLCRHNICEDSGQAPVSNTEVSLQ